MRGETKFEIIARNWWTDWSGNKNERHATYVMKRLEADAFPRIGSRPVSELNAPAFVRMAKSIEARGAADIARRVLQTCGQVMRYAVAHGLVERNPVAEVRPGDVPKARQQVNFARIELADLPELLRKFMAYDGSVYTRLALKLTVLTFVRTGELIGAGGKNSIWAMPNGACRPNGRRADASTWCRCPDRRSKFWGTCKPRTEIQRDARALRCCSLVSETTALR